MVYGICFSPVAEKEKFSEMGFAGKYISVYFILRKFNFSFLNLVASWIRLNEPSPRWQHGDITH